MKGAYVDVNSRTVQCVGIGVAKDFSQGEIVSGSDFSGVVRFKNTGDADGRIRIQGQGGDGVVISAGETEYFGIYPEENVEIVSGTFNVM